MRGTGGGAPGRRRDRSTSPENRNKRAVCVDLKNADERERLIALIGSADVFLHDLRPGAAEASGLGAAALRARFPRLIYGDLGAFGHRGPLSDRPGYELLLQWFGGLMSITGEPGREGVRCGPSLNDLGTGIWAAIGILAALIRRGRTDEGCLIEASLFETALCWGGVSRGKLSRLRRSAESRRREPSPR